MTFRRTDSGLSRMHRFLGVDAVVFVEGGKTSYTLQQVGSGSYTAQADDLKYWQVIFSKFATGQALHFRAVGSKNTIREIGLLAASGKITHVFAAMDRDLDHLNSSLPNGPGTFHTAGYSWENDVWTDAVVFATFKKFSTVPEAEKAAEREISGQFALIRRKLRHCVRVDALLVANSLQPLHREKFNKVVLPVKSGPPTYSARAARLLVKEGRQKARPQRVSRAGPAPDTLVDCYGHLIENFGYHLLVHILSKYCKLKVTPRDLLVPAAIDAFSEALNSNGRLTAHYAPLFSRITWGSP